MFDRANVILHAHASARNADGLKLMATSVINTTEQKSVESTSKSPEPKRNPDVLMERCISEIKDSSKNLTDTLKANEETKMVYS